MVKSFFVLALVAFLVGTTALLVIHRMRANRQTTAATIGINAGNVSASPAPAQSVATAQVAEEKVLEGGLRIRDIVAGTGDEAVPGMSVAVHYTGNLPDGTVFDSSRSGDKPFVFRLGMGEVIRGWDLGVAGMRVGGRRTLVIPAALAYGSRGAGGVIPPDAVLTFDVELLAVQSAVNSQ